MAARPRVTMSEFRGLMAKAPAGTTPEGILAGLKQNGYEIEGYPDTTSTGAPVAGTAGREAVPAWKALAGRGLELLPPALATAGGIIGGGGGTLLEPGGGTFLGGLAGAGVGAATGRGLRNVGRTMLGMEAPQGLGPTALDLGVQGALGAGEYGMGLGLERGAGAIGGPLIEKALGASKRLRRAYPKVLEAARRERIPLRGPGKPQASAEAGRRMFASVAKHDEILKAAEAAGVRIHAEDIADPVMHMLDTMTDQPLASGDRKKVQEMLLQFIQDHPGPMTPQTVNKMKQLARQQIGGILKRSGTPQPGANAADALTARFNDAIGQGAQRALERMGGPAGGYGPQVAGQNATTADLMGLRDALHEAELAGGKMNFNPFGEVFPFGHATPYARLSRPQASQLGHALTGPRTRLALMNSPRMLDELARQLYYSDAPADQVDQGGY